MLALAIISQQPSTLTVRFSVVIRVVASAIASVTARSISSETSTTVNTIGMIKLLTNATPFW
ncbi:hypothetical protein FOMPIDRAFT_1023986 [Fomitopsis schrenkii]|uniref:Uncharacterized protein n=1 Tax=Fomitopsis schrenkii TaxID=2126942 RepID=S8E9M0_FOMSC|nr:hypothetical protein FOMPIDRAFT_122418 [Fomitopsis schrenkii]EPT00004.1 hypothetical protein FOMPIDRAFT_1023986 [Fomitopsis schrenkii]